MERCVPCTTVLQDSQWAGNIQVAGVGAVVVDAVVRVIARCRANVSGSIELNRIQVAGAGALVVASSVECGAAQLLWFRSN